MPSKAGTVSYEATRLADYTRDDSIERGGIDLPFTLLTLLLLLIGVIMVLSASFARAYYEVNGDSGGNATYYFVRQALFALCGIGVMFVCSRFPMSTYYSFSGFLMLVSLVLLVFVPAIGTEAGGAKRWIDLGFTTFQPSEITKIAVVMYFAVLLCRFKDKMRQPKYGILPFAAILALIVSLLMLERHMSAIIIILVIGLVMLFLGGLPLWWFLAGGAAAIGLLAFGYMVFPYVRERISSWADPFADMSGDGYQIVQSLYAIGSGGLRGLGLGNSRQKYLYLPEEHNDFIFSIWCEELGFIGAALILVLFAMLFIRGYWIAMHARDRYSCLVGAGLTTHLAMQVILNVAVCTGLIPCTGISLPFFSFGGTALLMQMAEIGIILSISRDIPEKRRRS